MLIVDNADNCVNVKYFIFWLDKSTARNSLKPAVFCFYAFVQKQIRPHIFFVAT